MIDMVIIYPVFLRRFLLKTIGGVLVGQDK